MKILSNLFSIGSVEENNLHGLEYLNREGLFNETSTTYSKDTNAISPH